jgi:hypothetical protein
METPNNKKGSHGKHRKRLYNVLSFIRKKDVVEAMHVLREKLKEKDRIAAQYLLDQACGTAVQRQELKNPEGETFRVVFHMPPKLSQMKE